MSCTTCQVKFSFFTRENGCPSCGFSYCSKCLKYKCNVPKIGMKKVCGKCYNKFKTADNSSQPSPVTPPEEGSPPEGSDSPLAPVDIMKKLDSLENPAKPPIVMYKQGGHWDRLKTGLEPADQQIVDRLRKLKDEDKPVPLPSVEEIRRRLALLKDEDPDKPHNTINIHKVDTRTDHEKTEDLIKEYLEKLELSSKTSVDDHEIRNRLDRLRGLDSAKLSNKDAVEEDEDEHEVVKKMIKKALAEAALERKYEDVDELEEMEVEAKRSSSEEEDEELPWCVICNEDAQLRCLGCSGDLYCSSCFRQGHDSFEMVDHQSVPFKPAKKPSPD